MKDATAEFFKLPIEEKEKYGMPSNDIQGYGHASDALILITKPTWYKKLQFWPKTPEGFIEIIETYASEVRRVGEELISSLSVIMKKQKHFLLGLHKESLQGIRVNYYPPCSSPEQVLGLSSHSDTSTITLLMQDDDVIGLEIRHQGGWVPVAPITDALVVNVGDVIEIWSNGKYKSVEHRAVTNKIKKRTSYAYFISPQDDVEVEPLDHMINAENPKLYQKVRAKMNLNVDHDLVTKMEEAHTLAPSIPVPNVQEMVRNNPLQVPKRYVRSEEELEKLNTMPHLSYQIPVIDLALLSCRNSEELLKLDVACKEWGFFQIVNHGVQKELLQRMKDASAEFFKLPIEEKEKYAMPSNDIQGYGHAYVVSEEQTLDWSDALMFVTYPTRYRKLQYWPQTPHGFKEIIEAYASEVRRVGEELLNSLSQIMGMQKHVLLELHKESLQGLRVNYYPPCSAPEQVLGLSPHSDTSTITLLMQDDDVVGLEIRHQGRWVSVTPISDALVVNVGDVIEIWSNGKYKSVEHRAVTNKNKKRTSYALFVCPQEDVEVEPLDHMISALNPKLYQKVKYGDYLRQSMKRKMEGKAHTDVVRIQASDVSNEL
ncbi:hypothetical protein VNO78_12183 [Psophocarpus tetragonolobus]|uniref:Fe2OG dioxygenase domain-containing protein n=1 Tax=Psophocarpus tetragonolobus TaxID=3891 RepID=A0AAN9SQA8_PSOTE